MIPGVLSALRSTLVVYPVPAANVGSPTLAAKIPTATSAATVVVTLPEETGLHGLHAAWFDWSKGLVVLSPEYCETIAVTSPLNVEVQVTTSEALAIVFLA